MTMAIIEIKKNPGRRDLLFFELFFVGVLLAIGAYVYYRTRQPTIPALLAAAAGVSFILFRLAPKLRRLAFLGWLYLTLPIGLAISHVLLACLYFVLLTPIGWIRRLFGGGKVTRGFDPSAGSYWIEIETESSIDRYFKQF
jgi:hypothetical protein